MSRGGILHEILDATKNLRAQSGFEQIDENGDLGTQSAPPAVAPPPDMTMLGELATWNEAK